MKRLKKQYELLINLNKYLRKDISNLIHYTKIARVIPKIFHEIGVLTKFDVTKPISTSKYGAIH